MFGWAKRNRPRRRARGLGLSIGKHGLRIWIIR
jgi:hypothetical protein